MEEWNSIVGEVEKVGVEPGGRVGKRVDGVELLVEGRRVRVERMGLGGCGQMWREEKCDGREGRERG